MVEDLEEALAVAAEAQEEADSAGAVEALTEVDSEVLDPRTVLMDHTDLSAPEDLADRFSAVVGSIDRITVAEVA